jgi:hypothetical protein
VSRRVCRIFDSIRSRDISGSRRASWVFGMVTLAARREPSWNVGPTQSAPVVRRQMPAQAICWGDIVGKAKGTGR